MNLDAIIARDPKAILQELKKLLMESGV